MVLLGLAILAAAIFLAGSAFPYFTLNQQRFGPYWPKRGWLLLHIVPGMIALSTGPFVLWLGLNRRRMKLHRGLGIVYMSSIAVSSIAAFYLATHTDFGWIFGAGLSGLATAWIITTALALVSIRKRLITQHQEWMIRSYVVTFAFVNFRIFAGVLQAAGVGTMIEQFSAASWFCWAVPLLITEIALQGRKIFTAQTRRSESAVEVLR
jgi:hypothetical protein